MWVNKPPAMYVRILTFFITSILINPHSKSKTLIVNDSSKVYNTSSATHLHLQREYITGPRGGCYYINKNGNKTYVDHSYCNGNSAASTSSSKKKNVSYSAPSTRGNSYTRGSKGGCYYISVSGRKVYVSRDKCN